MNKLHLFLERLSVLEYAKNSLSKKTHDQKVESLLIKSEFKKIISNKKISKNEFEILCIEKTKEFNNDVSYFIRERNGSHNFPDFTIYSNKHCFDLECKSNSSKNGFKAMWNCTFPKSDAIYLISNKTNSILLNGDEITTLELEKINELYEKSLINTSNECNNLYNLLTTEKNPYKMKVYQRKMYTQHKHLDINKKNEYLQNILLKYN